MLSIAWELHEDIMSGFPETVIIISAYVGIVALDVAMVWLWVRQTGLYHRKP
jgi:hypothetical protein